MTTSSMFTLVRHDCSSMFGGEWGRIYAIVTSPQRDLRSRLHGLEAVTLQLFRTTYASDSLEKREEKFEVPLTHEQVLKLVDVLNSYLAGPKED